MNHLILVTNEEIKRKCWSNTPLGSTFPGEVCVERPVVNNISCAVPEVNFPYFYENRGKTKQKY